MSRRAGSGRRVVVMGVVLTNRRRLLLALTILLLLPGLLAPPGHAQPGPAPPLTLVAPPTCSSGIPDVRGCIGPIASELQGLQRLSCLLDALNRWRLRVIACAQSRIDEWQAKVVWPLGGRRPVAASLARVRTLREEAEALAEARSWLLDPPQAALASLYTSPEVVAREDYEAAWSTSLGVGRDLQDLVAWNSAHTRNTIQARTSASFGLDGELPENTWERIGREGARMLDQDDRDTDPLSAIRLTPQMIADRLRVETSTTRLSAQALVTAQLQRDYRRLRREREQHLGALMLATLTRRAAEPEP